MAGLNTIHSLGKLKRKVINKKRETNNKGGEQQGEKE